MSSSLAKLGMLACCAVMALPIVVYFVAGGTVAGVTGNLAAFAPLLLCAGAHILMFKLMGKSCHGTSEDSEPEGSSEAAIERPTNIPVSGARSKAAARS